MAHMIQLELTNFFCSAADFQDRNFHYDRIWRHLLYMFKIKIFKLMFHYVRVQSNVVDGNFPQGWHTFSDQLQACHVLNRETFHKIMNARNQELEELQAIGYKQLSLHEIELFDQSSTREFLKANFTLNEFVLAAGEVQAQEQMCKYY
jgi:hypothetical protein